MICEDDSAVLLPLAKEMSQKKRKPRCYWAELRIYPLGCSGVAYAKKKATFFLSVVPKLYLDLSRCGETAQLRCYVLEPRLTVSSGLTLEYPTLRPELA